MRNIIIDFIDYLTDLCCYDCPSLVACEGCRAKRFREILDFFWRLFV